MVKKTLMNGKKYINNSYLNIIIFMIMLFNGELVYANNVNSVKQPDFLFVVVLVILLLTSISLIILLYLNIKQKNVYKEKLKFFQNNLAISYKELAAANDELIANEEELKSQYEELERKKEELRISRERYRLAAKGAEVGIWEWEVPKDSLYLSNKAKEILSIENSDSAILIETILDKILETDRKNVVRNYYEHINKKIDVLEAQFRIQTKENRFLWMKIRGKALFDENGNVLRMAGSVSDISDEKLAEAKIHKLAFRDELTGISNRISFLNELQKEMDRRKEDCTIGVYVIDVDNFKSINDTLGHSCGDMVLRKIVLCLQKCLGANDMLARFGGDEFVIYRLANSKEPIEQLASDIVTAFSQGLEVDGQTLNLSVSIGIARIPEDEVTVEDILKCADIAMSQAKKNGKNCYEFHTPKLKNEVVRRSKIEKDLRNALLNNEFTQVYQPIFNIRTNKITGFEALIRWMHPELGAIPPNEFIPIAENLGIITEIGDWVTTKAIKQLKDWHQQGHDHLTISINLSARQFKDLNLGEKLTSAMLEVNLDPKFIDVEITETAALCDINYASNILREFRDTGMHVSLDDFGTGYSSLNYLKNLPFTNLKIDKSFIDDIMEEKKGEEIIRTIIALSHAYGMKVIAEGVETKEQFEFLKQENCDLVQGYYISKPLLATDVNALLTGTA